MTLGKYIIGFVLSLFLTLVSYFLVMTSQAGNKFVFVAILALAVTQMVVQLVFFLHLGEEATERQKNVSFIFMAGTLMIVLVGSIWALSNMNYNMMQMSPTQKENYMTSRSELAF